HLPSGDDLAMVMSARRLASEESNSRSTAERSSRQSCAMPWRLSYFTARRFGTSKNGCLGMNSSDSTLDAQGTLLMTLPSNERRLRGAPAAPAANLCPSGLNARDSTVYSRRRTSRAEIASPASQRYIDVPAAATRRPSGETAREHSPSWLKVIVLEVCVAVSQ